MNETFILAAADADTFWGTGIGETIQSLLIAVGILVVLFALFKGVPKFIAGDIGKGLRAVVGGLIVAAICFNPELLTGLIDVVANLIGQGSEGVGEMTGGSGTGGTR